jgi:hypothetical protein
MTVKLNNKELTALVMCLKITIDEYALMNENNALDVQGKVYKSLFELMWIDFTKKLFERKNKYNIKFKPYTALVFWDEYNGKIERTSLAGNAAQTICDAIHKKYII